LEGLQHTPVNLWFPAFASLLSDRRRPANLLVFASIGGSLLDRERTLPNMPKLVVALSPATPDGLSSQLLASMSRQELPRANFSATEAPVPTRPDILKFVENIEGRVEQDALKRAGGAYRAAWPLADRIDVGSWALAFGHPDGANEGAALRLRQGAAWLTEILNN